MYVYKHRFAARDPPWLRCVSPPELAKPAIGGRPQARSGLAASTCEWGQPSLQPRHVASRLDVFATSRRVATFSLRHVESFCFRRVVLFRESGSVILARPQELDAREVLFGGLQV